MGMFDDLDPDFISSPGPALPIVAMRVAAIRKRRWIVVGSGLGAVAIALAASLAFGSGGSSDKLTVAKEVTTTTDDSSSTTGAPLVTAPTTATSTTATATSTTVTLPIASTSTSEATTTTTLPPAELTVAFDRDSLVIQSGTSRTISYTVTNDGGQDGTFGTVEPRCVPDQSVWPEHVSQANPLLWPVPAQPRVVCIPLRLIRVPAHESRTVSVTIVAGLHDSAGNVVPAPPGHDSFLVQNGTAGGGVARLPVTITPPATPPLTVDHPSEVTTGSNQQHVIDFTITNNLPFPVRYTDQGPCSQEIGVSCRATTKDGAITMDMRLPPYKTAVKPLYVSHFLLGANEVKVAHAQVHGTTSLEDIGLGSPGLPPGVYHFDWDGQKVKFTIT